MGSKVKQPILLPCWGDHDLIYCHQPDLYVERAAMTAADYFGPPAKPFFLGTGERVFEFCGQHCFREDEHRACLKDVITGEKFDLGMYDFDRVTGLKGPWNMINEMEVLAWVSR
jgi:hypothetical protein